MKAKFLNIGKIILVFLLIAAIVSVTLSVFGGSSSSNKVNQNGISKIESIDKVTSPLAGKYISFLGDSITTYEGWSNSTSFNTSIGGNGVYYNASSGLTVHDTWWKQLIDNNGMRLCVNNSCDASRITETHPDNIPSGYFRYSNLHNDIKNIRPDIIVFFMGTNDIGNGVPLVSTYGPVVEDVPSFKLSLLESLSLTVLSVCNKYPDADIFVCTLPPESRTVSKQEELELFNQSIRAFEDELDNCYVVDLFSDSGITYDNYMNYTIDDGTMRVHPNKAGMDLITKCVQETFERVYNF